MIKPDFFTGSRTRSHNNCPNEQIIAAGNVDKLQCDTMVSILFLYSSNMDGQRHQMVGNACPAFY